MKPIQTVNEAIQLMRNFIILSKPYGGSSIFYTLDGDSILVINNNFRAYITIDDFKEHFNESKYYLYKDTSEEEIAKEDFVKLRQ